LATPGEAAMLIKSENEWHKHVSKIKQGPPYLVLDVETTGVRPYQGDKIVGVAVRYFNKKMEPTDIYLPVRHQQGKNIPPAAIHALAPILGDPTWEWINHEIKFDRHFMEGEGLTVRAKCRDSILAAHVNNENEFSLKLEDLGYVYVRKDAGDAEAALYETAKTKYKYRAKQGPNSWKSHMAEYLPEEVEPYACNDVRLAWETYNEMVGRVASQGLTDILFEVFRYAEIGFGMEKIGVGIDPKQCRQSIARAEKEKARIEAQIFELAGKEININSGPQLCAAMGLPRGTCLDKEHLPEIDHPIAQYVVEYRQWGRAVTNYWGKFLEVMGADNRIHTDLDLHGTISTRLSCRNPPLQALPRGNDVYKVRDVIAARPGYTLVSFDYSQIELRVLAYYTQDVNLVSAYLGGTDIHTQTAQATGLPRDIAPGAKTLNFASVYGLGVTGCMRKFKYSEAQARDLLDRFHRQYPGIKRLYKECERYAKRHRGIPLWTGRMRHITQMEQPHKAMSNLIQGGVAEIMRVAITRLADYLEGTDSFMILQVHDDILFEVPDRDVKRRMPEIQAIMQDFAFPPVPIVAEGKFGKTWGRMQKWQA
jgi:DNA polymerase-1